MQLPKLRDHSSASAYFAEFYRLNQNQSSHRGFAAEIDWPASLLGDLIQGRKRLAVSRAVEFSRHFGLSSLDCEFLVMLGLAETEHEGSRAFAESSLRASTPQREPTRGHAAPMKAEVYANTDLTLLHALLRWTESKLPLDEAVGLLPEGSPLRELTHLKNLSAALVNQGVAKGEFPHLHLTQNNLYCDEPETESQRAQLAQAADATKRLGAQVAWSAGTVVLPSAQLPELRARIFALTDWLLNTATREAPGPGSKIQEHEILHACLAGFRLSRPASSRKEDT